MKVLGISGSLRAGSHNTQLLRAAGGLLPPGGELVSLDGLKAIPPFDEDDEPRPARRGARRCARRDRRRRRGPVATPEYNHSLPGQLKNALDWVSRPLADSPLRNKPVAVVGASTGMFGAVWAQAELRKVLGALGARVIDRELPVRSATMPGSGPASSRAPTTARRWRSTSARCSAPSRSPRTRPWNSRGRRSARRC